MLSRTNKPAKIGTLLRNSGDGAKVLQVVEILNRGHIVKAKSYGRVVAGVWHYYTRPRIVWLSLSRFPGSQGPTYFSAGVNVNWHYVPVQES